MWATRYYSLLLFFIAIQFAGLQGSAQNTPWKAWTSVNFNVPMTRKLDLRLSHLRAYDLNKGENDFNQTQARLSYDITKRLNFLVGGLINQIPGSTSGVRKRVFVRAAYEWELTKAIQWTNGLQAELNSANETRFKYRLILQSRIGLDKRLSFLNLSPSISYHLFYNIGGSTIQYFDKAGNATIRQAPNGFHRGRLFLNLNSKINNRFNISLYLMTQREFNFLSDENRRINVLNPANGRISRSYDDFNVAGLSINVSLGKKDGRKPWFHQ